MGKKKIKKRVRERFFSDGPTHIHKAPTVMAPEKDKGERKFVGVMACAPTEKHPSGRAHSVVYRAEKRLVGALLKAYGMPTKGEKGLPIWYIPEKLCAIGVRKVTNVSNANTCLYRACNEYMEHWFGRKMQWADEDWFKSHPLGTQDGIPQEHTLRVVHELIAPYELGISRVLLPPGVSLSEELKPWLYALGCNPLAIVDRQTSNLAFAKQTGMDIEQVDRMFRVEFTEEKVRPSIMCGAFSVTVTDKQGKSKSTLPSGGGHAEYVGVRTAPRKDPFLQVQLGWLKDLPPLNIELPALAASPEKYTEYLQPYLCRDENGNELTLVEKGEDILELAKKFYAEQGLPFDEPYTAPTTTTTTQAPKGMRPMSHLGGNATVKRCSICNVYVKVDSLWADGVCNYCAKEMVNGYSCTIKSCHSDWGKQLPAFYSIDTDKEGMYILTVKCRTCKEIQTISEWDGLLKWLYEAAQNPIDVVAVPPTSQGTLWDGQNTGIH